VDKEENILRSIHFPSAIIRLVDGFVKTFNNEGKPLSVCGSKAYNFQNEGALK